MRALIVGGGIGGMATAVALRRAGVRPSVFETRDDPEASQVGGGFHIWANGVRAVRDLGLESRIQEIGARIEKTAAGTERVTFGGARRSVMHHVGGERLFWAVAIYGPEADAGRPPGRKEMLLDRFDGWPGTVCDAIRGTPEAAITGLAVFDRPTAKRWGRGRATLLGDAAHPMTTNTRDSHRAANMNRWSDPLRLPLRDVLFGLVLPSAALRGLRATVAVQL